MKKRLFIMGISFILFMVQPLSVLATPLSELQQQKAENEEKLEELNEEIEALNEESKGITEEIEVLDDLMVEIIASVSLLEDEIEEVEENIEITKGELEEAVAQEEAQYADMKKRIQYMYEKGRTSYVSLMLGSGSVSDVLNRSEYVEKMYEYDDKVLKDYVAAKEAVEAKKLQLEEQQAELETNIFELEEEQKVLDDLITEKREQQEDFETKLTKAKQEAAAYKAKIKKQNNQIKKLEEEARKAAEEAAKKAEKDKNGNKGGKGSDVINQSQGSASGKEIAQYACKFVGNPYVAGGTSLTNGADCSGFTQSVYKAFGYSIPRTSTAQRSAGRGVTYAEAQPGDIICYAGHVAIYIGGGQIVHASTPATGIKYGYATYREILAVRRIVK